MQEKRFQRLPDAELDVMLVLWAAKQEVKTSALLEELNRTRSWSMSTLQALLARLSERGFVEAKTRGRLKYYSPAVSEEDYRARETKTFMERFYKNSFQDLFASLVNTHSISKEDIRALEEMLHKEAEEND